MQKLVAAILIISVSILAGCGTTAKIKTEYHLVQGEKFKFQYTDLPNINGEERAYLPNDTGISLLHYALSKRLERDGLLASENDVTARTLEVTVTSFRIRNESAKYLSGLVPESDNIQSTVNIKEQGSGKILSEFTVESKNYTATGTLQSIINDHADSILATLKGEKR